MGKIVTHHAEDREVVEKAQLQMLQLVQSLNQYYTHTMARVGRLEAKIATTDAVLRDVEAAVAPAGADPDEDGPADSGRRR